MASNHTTNLKLNQWAASDAILRADFNNDNAKIDAAYKELMGEVTVGRVYVGSGDMPDGYCVQIDYDYFKRYYPHLDEIRFSNLLEENSNNQIKSVIKSIVLSAQDKGKNYELLVASHLLSLLYYLLDYATDKQGDLIANKKNSERNKKMIKILAYIHTNYNFDIDARSVAAQFNISQGHLTRLFKEHVGIPPKRYIDEYRLDRAAEQIIYTDDAIVDIAFLNGFSNINSFYKMFNKKFGMAPNSYRKHYQVQRED